ncbi:hypothetical protein J6590_098107 [Homalodisca vitripennis]|nr:hypothetical protein J6590_098107 [Homalodisca vitripennis]
MREFFQMDTLEVRPGSQASTARLSRKSGEEEVETGENDAPGSGDLQKDEDQKVEHDSLNSLKDGSVKSLKVGSGQSNGDECEQKSSDSGLAIDEAKESDTNIEYPQDKDAESHLSQSRKSSTSEPTQEKNTEVKENFSRHNSSEIDVTQGEETVIIENDTPLTAIPIERKDTPKQEDTEDDKEKDGKQSPLSVELPPEVKAESRSGSVEQEETATVDSETVHQTPTPTTSSQDNNLRSQSSSSNDVRQPVVETPVEATVIPPTECEIPAEDSELAQTVSNNEESNNLTNSPDGKNDSAISSSSISPEKNLHDPDLDDRQGTPVIEVA